MEGPHQSARVEGAEIMPSSTKTADDGRFQISGLAPGRYQVVATATGLGSARVETFVVGASTRELVIVVEDRAHVSGKVMSGGQPLSGVEVTSLGPPHLADAAPVFSQDDGSFAIDGVPYGELQWKVRGYRVKTPKATVVKGARLDGVILDVERGATLRGHVTFDGVPAAGATVYYFHNEWAHGFLRTSKSVLSDASGAYVLDDVVPGPSRILANTEQAAIDEAWVEVLADRDTIRDLVLDHAASASGIVVDTNGAPVPNVDVVFQLDPWVDSPWRERTTMTDSAGRFDDAPLSAGTYTVLVAPDDGVPDETYKLVHPVTVQLATDRARATGLRVEVSIDHLEISGTVVDDHGVVLPDVRVQLGSSLEIDRSVISALLPPSAQPNPALISSEPNTVTDSRGAFRFRGLQHVKYTVRARGADGGEALAVTDAGSGNVTLTLPRSGSIEGTLVGFGPAPAANATNSTDVARDATVDGTHFEVIGLHAGTYAVSAQDDHGASAQTVEVHAGATTNVTLEAHGRGHIEIHDTLFGVGTPVAGVRCITSPRTSGIGPWWNNDSLVVTDATGHASLPAAAGAMRLNCLGREGYSRVQRDVVVPANGSVDADVESVPVKPGGSQDPGFTMLDEQLPPTVSGLRSDPALHSGLAVGDQIISIDGASTLPF
ncbi:MAG TPA: carboxypeptidase regulatory-like domain-containing protein, partial [Kofleriaceae bacterium]